MTPAIIVDLDGTLADMEHRVKYVRQEKKDWKTFFGKMVEDSLNEWCKQIIDKFKHTHKIIILTGRPYDYCQVTMNWIDKNSVHYDYVFMRKKNDYRRDDLIKREIYKEKIKPNFDVLFCIDDRQAVVDMWRNEGLVCLQCQQWAEEKKSGG